MANLATTNITVIGHVCIDKNTSEHSSYSAAGSPAMFMDRIFKQFPDNRVTIITPYGADFLEHNHNSRLYPHNPVGEKTLIYENITKNDFRIQKAHHREAAFPVQPNPDIKKIVSTSDIIFIAPLLPNYPPSYLKTILSKVSKNTLKVLLPQGYFRDFDADDTVLVRPFKEAALILPLVDVVIVSEQDHPDMIKLAKIWAKKYQVIVIITLGERGAIAVTSRKLIDLPTVPVSKNEIVDSVGSGDIFSAGFAFRFHQTRDIKKAGEFANRLARQCLFYASADIKINYRVLLVDSIKD